MKTRGINKGDRCPASIGDIRRRRGDRRRWDDGFALTKRANVILSPHDIGL